jgi:hypothetical protein
MRSINDRRNVAHSLDRGGAPLGAVRALARRHHRDATEALDLLGDPFVIGGDDHVRHVGHVTSGAPTPFDQRAFDAARALELGERLARKARRRETGGNDDQG